MRRRRRESIQEKQARSFCLLANSNRQRRKPIHVRMGGSALHHHRQHWTTRREESRGRAGVGLKPRRPSRGGSRPAPAERGRDRHWHWQAGGLVPGRARFGISRGVCCAGGVGAVGRSIAATFRVPTVGRSPAPASAACRTALASFTNFHGHVHASLLPQQYCRPQLVQQDARRSAGGPVSEGQGRPTELLPVRRRAR